MLNVCLKLYLIKNHYFFISNVYLIIKYSSFNNGINNKYNNNTVVILVRQSKHRNFYQPFVFNWINIFIIIVFFVQTIKYHSIIWAWINEYTLLIGAIRDSVKSHELLHVKHVTKNTTYLLLTYILHIHRNVLELKTQNYHRNDKAFMHHRIIHCNILMKTG